MKPISYDGVRVADSWEQLPAAIRERWATHDAAGVRTTDCKDGEVDKMVWQRLGRPPRDSEAFTMLRSDYRMWVRTGRHGPDPVSRYLEIKAAEQAAAKPVLRTGTRDSISNIISLAAVNRAHKVKFAPTTVHDHDLRHQPIASLHDINVRNAACWRHA